MSRNQRHVNPIDDFTHEIQLLRQRVHELENVGHGHRPFVADLSRPDPAGNTGYIIDPQQPDAATSISNLQTRASYDNMNPTWDYLIRFNRDGFTEDGASYANDFAWDVAPSFGPMPESPPNDPNASGVTTVGEVAGGIWLDSNGGEMAVALVVYVPAGIDSDTIALYSNGWSTTGQCAFLDGYDFVVGHYVSSTYYEEGRVTLPGPGCYLLGFVLTAASVVLRVNDTETDFGAASATPANGGIDPEIGGCVNASMPPTTGAEDIDGTGVVIGWFGSIAGDVSDPEEGPLFLEQVYEALWLGFPNLQWGKVTHWYPYITWGTWSSHDWRFIPQPGGIYITGVSVLSAAGGATGDWYIHYPHGPKSVYGTSVYATGSALVYDSSFPSIYRGISRATNSGSALNVYAGDGDFHVADDKPMSAWASGDHITASIFIPFPGI